MHICEREYPLRINNQKESKLERESSNNNMLDNYIVHNRFETRSDKEDIEPRRATTLKVEGKEGLIIKLAPVSPTGSPCLCAIYLLTRAFQSRLKLNNSIRRFDKKKNVGHEQKTWTFFSFVCFCFDTRRPKHDNSTRFD